jgi:hypothetical protein
LKEEKCMRLFKRNGRDLERKEEKRKIEEK